MTTRLETELLVGVLHYRESVGQVLDFIDKRYPNPNRPQSLMLELPPPHQQTSHQGFTYSLEKVLEDAYSSEGSRIVYGDKPLPKSILKSLNGGRTINDKGLILRFAGLMLFDIVDTLIFHSRDRHMLKIMEREKPQVVVLARSHANYIKKKHPEIPYTAFTIPGKEKKGFLAPYKPNEIITIDV